MNSVICTVDVVLLTLKEGHLMVALCKRSAEPYKNVFAIPGGYIHPDEDSDAFDAAMRVLRTKTGIAAPYLEQLATFAGPVRDPRGWSVSIAHYALVPIDVISQAAQIHADVQLHAVDGRLTLPFDHRTIVQAAVERVRSKSQYSSLPCYLAGECFTLPHLQRIYEHLMGEPLNKVSFRRKMAEMDMLEPVAGAMDASGAHRPAQLYRLKREFRARLQLIEGGL